MPLSDRGSERKGPPFKSAETSSKRAPKKKILRGQCGEQEVEEGMREDKRRFFGGASARSLGRCRALARSLRPHRKTFVGRKEWTRQVAISPPQQPGSCPVNSTRREGRPIACGVWVVPQAPEPSISASFTSEACGA